MLPAQQQTADIDCGELANTLVHLDAKEPGVSPGFGVGLLVD